MRRKMQFKKLVDKVIPSNYFQRSHYPQGAAGAKQGRELVFPTYTHTICPEHNGAFPWKSPQDLYYCNDTEVKERICNVFHTEVLEIRHIFSSLAYLKKYKRSEQAAKPIGFGCSLCWKKRSTLKWDGKIITSLCKTDQLHNQRWKTTEYLSMQNKQPLA